MPRRSSMWRPTLATRCGYSNLKVQGGRTITASFDVTNTGRIAGDAVPQVYLTSRPGKAVERLVGFSRITLIPGETRHVTLTADPRILADFDVAAHGWRIRSGEYTVSLARSAGDPTATATVRLHGRVLPP